MRVFKTKTFARFTRHEGITDKALAKAVDDMERGLIDANLGGELFKQRVVRLGGGKRGGYRTLIAYRTHEKAIFLFGFAKSNQENISADDERNLKDYSALLLALKREEIELMIENGELLEVPYGKEDKKVS